MFYAAEHYYGVEFCNDYSTLYRFASKFERDDYVADKNFAEAASGSVKTEAVTRDEARMRFPHAFRIVGDYHDECDARDWRKTDNFEYWSTFNLYE